MSVFVIGEKEYDTIKFGADQAVQVSRLGKWLSTYGLPVFREVNKIANVEQAGGAEVMLAFFGNLPPQALLELFEIVFGCSKEEADKYFDIAVLVEGVIDLVNNQPSIQRLVQRFFSNAPST